MTDEKIFFHVTGTILRTLNVIRGSRCGLKSLEFLFTGRIRHDEFLESINYLSGRGYIKFWDYEGGKITKFVEKDFESTDVSLSDAGIQVLRGEIPDEFVEV